MLVREQGFSVVELMVVVTIIGILAAVAAPSFREATAASRVKTLSSDIHLSLIRARSEAIKRNTNITVSAPSGWLGGWTISNNIETHAAIPASDVTASGTTTVTYAATGRVTANPISISISSTSTTVKRCVTVNLSGQPVVKQDVCS